MSRTNAPNKLKESSLVRYAWLSIGAAVMTMGLKLLAYLFTDSVGLLSDALEYTVKTI